MDTEAEPVLSPALAVLVGGNTAVGRALEVLLGSIDLTVSFRAESALDDPGLLDGARLLLIAPHTSEAIREALIEAVDRGPLGERIPILELTTEDRDTHKKAGHTLLSWPCPTEELKRRVWTALLPEPDMIRQGPPVLAGKAVTGA